MRAGSEETRHSSWGLVIDVICVDQMVQPNITIVAGQFTYQCIHGTIGQLMEQSFSDTDIALSSMLLHVRGGCQADSAIVMNTWSP
jgi:hypothetical protein